MAEGHPESGSDEVSVRISRYQSARMHEEREGFAIISTTRIKSVYETKLKGVALWLSGKQTSASKFFPATTGRAQTLKRPCCSARLYEKTALRRRRLYDGASSNVLRLETDTDEVAEQTARGGGV